MKIREILGIDFGGSGIKGAPVDTKKGKLLAERFRLVTPKPATPESVLEVVGKIIDNFNWKGPVGIGFPTVVMNGIIKTAANIDKSWIGIDAQKMFMQAYNLPVVVLNDADAAGMAELKFGAGKGIKGTILLVTIGTGIGSVLFVGKKLVANTELGHLFLESGIEAEHFTSDATRQFENLDWNQWGVRFNKYLMELEKLFWPELIIIGGGISKKGKEFEHAITIQGKYKMASLKNEAGIIGAALAARKFAKNL